ncbi:MAG: T9SS type A sorting domain-containing protein [Bacteroidetes bacterium]|nr:T9SS type A sorting domain-containing protein [Bacteroidota bacterium]MBS1973988.1 T9SS type A sorting domain-containing protein [Bacteroidota bacterium]
MKKLYFLTSIFVCSFILLSPAYSQNYSGGIYTAVRNGNWHTPSGINVWDVNGEPPSICNNCLITINSGVTVTLNTDIFLQGTSTLNIGSDGSATSKINIPGTNGSAPSPSVAPLPISGKNRIDLEYSHPGNVQIHLLYANSILDASNTRRYDGVYLYLLLGTPNTNGGYGEIKRMGRNSYPAFPSSTTRIITGPASTLTSDGTLPVILTSFNAQLVDNACLLTWTSELEINSSRFEIQRSGDGATWLAIGTVAAKGNSATSTDYSFTDPSPLSGTNYYRLKEIDLDGNFKLSDIRQVRAAFIKGVKLINPAKSTVQVTFGSDFSSNLSLRLLSLNGKILQQRQVNNPAGTTIYLPVSNYANGIYMLHVIAADGSQKIYKIAIAN